MPILPPFPIGFRNAAIYGAAIVALIIVQLQVVSLSVAAEEPEEASSEQTFAPRMVRPFNAAETPQFTMPTLELAVGETAMLAIVLPEAVSEDVIYEYSVDRAERLGVMNPPAFLKGHKTGFVRLNGLQVGQATFRIGRSQLKVKVRAPDKDANDSTVLSEVAPRIITPVNGAAVWDTFVVGVEGLRDVTGAAPTEIWLENPAGKKWKSATLEEDRPGSQYRATFSVEASQMGEGGLQPFARWDKQVSKGEVIFLSKITPDATHRFADEAENLAKNTIPRLRPVEGQSEEMPQPKARDRKSASNGKVVAMLSGGQLLRGRFTIKSSGMYQVFVDAAADYGGGAWPSVAIRVDDEEQPVALSRIATGDVHRIPVGKPFYLEEGERIIGFHFPNDFYVENNDRNLFLDRFELAKVDLTGRAENGLISSPVDLFDGTEIAGPAEIRVETRWRDNKNLTAKVELFINDEALPPQFGSKSRFRVEPRQLKPGVNWIRSAASLPSGERFVSPPQRLILPTDPRFPKAASTLKSAAGTAEWRVTPNDPAWSPGMVERLQQPKNDAPAFEAAFHGNGESILNLPHGMAGRYEVWFEGRGEEYKGKPKATLLKVQGEEREVLGEVAVDRWDKTVKLGEWDFSSGPKQVAIAFQNDAHDPDKGDRNLYMTALRFRKVEGDPPDKTAIFQVLYPKSKHQADEVDAVVLRWFSHGEPLPKFDLEIDGVELGLSETPSRLRGSAGLVKLPLITSQLSPGKHQILVVAKRGDERLLSDPITIEVKNPKAKNGSYARALHLLNRLAFGPDPAELAMLLALGEKEWLEQRLFSEDPYAVEATITAQEVLHGSRGGNRQVSLQALHGAVHSLNPVRDRFVFWAQNHFSTWINKTGATEKWNEHRAFNRSGIVPFESLLAVSARSPAMMVYLDQQRSFRGRMNENYARELLELHTVGVNAGYDQEDVTALARLLTGWTTAEISDLNGVSRDMVREFRFDAAVHETGTHRVFGFPFEEVTPDDAFVRIGVLFEMLSAHPETARFISKKIAEHYVAAPAPAALIDDLAKEFLVSRGDMRKLMLRMATHPVFFASMDVPRVAQPFDYAVRLARMTDSDNIGALNNFLYKSGTGLFDRSTPDGYPQTDASYVNSNAMLQRWHLAWELRHTLRRQVPGSWRSDQALKTPEGRRKYLDALSVSLTGKLLSPRSFEALEKMASREQNGSTDSLLLAILVAQMPEANLK